METNTLLKRETNSSGNQDINISSEGTEKINGMTVIKYNGIMDGPGGALGVASYTVADCNGNISHIFI